MKYKAILFDADGVIIKSKRLFTEQLEKDFGMKIENMLPFFKGVFKQCGIGKADLKQELSKVIEDWEWKGTVDELVDYWLLKGTEMDKDFIDFIKSIRNNGVLTYMVSDQEKYRGEYIRSVLEGDVLEKVFFSADIGFTKEQKEFWKYVLKNINFDAQDIFYIDDCPDNIKAAKEFGIDTYLYDGDFEKLKALLYE